jgi:hypothetical protein
MEKTLLFFHPCGRNVTSHFPTTCSYAVKTRASTKSYTAKLDRSKRHSSEGFLVIMRYPGAIHTRDDDATIDVIVMGGFHFFIVRAHMP